MATALQLAEPRLPRAVGARGGVGVRTKEREGDDEDGAAGESEEETRKGEEESGEKNP